MRYLKTAVTLASTLTLCACFGASGEPVSIPAPDTALTQACESPVALPDNPQVRHWAADRQRLVDCRDRHAGLVAWSQGVTE